MVSTNSPSKNRPLNGFLIFYVAAPEKRFEVWHSRGPQEGLVNVSCLAIGAFPEPKLSLYVDEAR
jgi:hypothetical protein